MIHFKALRLAPSVPLLFVALILMRTAAMLLGSEASPSGPAISPDAIGEPDADASWRYTNENWDENGYIRDGWLRWTGRALDGTVKEEWAVKLGDIDSD